MERKNHTLPRREVTTERRKLPSTRPEVTSGGRAAPPQIERKVYIERQEYASEIDRTLYITYFRDDNVHLRPHPLKPILALFSPRKEPTPEAKKFLCLMISAHNEEVVLGNTIQSAIDAGMQPEHIYVVDDNSDDGTSKVAKSILPKENVHRVRRSGKGLALSKAAKKFRLTANYKWIHIADADGAFAPNYFETLINNIDEDNAAITGYIRSLPGKRVSEFRAFEYTVGMELHRRIQNMLGVIPIIPGPTSCFRADVFDELNFANKALTEDFDVTLQIYRKQLGKIQFIPQAVAYTQDPLTTKAFVKQITRWNRGVMQGMSRHKVGQKLTPIDAYLTYQVGQGLLLFANTFVWIPYLVFSRGATGTSFLATTFVMDVVLNYIITFMAAMRSGRWDMLSAFPLIYAMKWISLGVFIRSFVEVILLRKFRITEGTWDNGAGRRYRMGNV